MTRIKSVRIPEHYHTAIDNAAGNKYDSKGELVRTAVSRFEPFLGVVPLRDFDEHYSRITVRDSKEGVIESFYETAEEVQSDSAQALRNAIGYELGDIEYDFAQLRENLAELEELDEERRHSNGQRENLNRIWKNVVRD